VHEIRRGRTSSLLKLPHAKDAKDAKDAKVAKVAKVAKGNFFRETLRPSRPLREAYPGFSTGG